MTSPAMQTVLHHVGAAHPTAVPHPHFEITNWGPQMGELGQKFPRYASEQFLPYIHIQFING